VNGERAAEGHTVGASALLSDRFVLLRKGKKAYAMVAVAP
jgi:hypothetical protein